MSYIDIIVTAAYPDRIDVTIGGEESYINGQWNYELAVVGTDMKPEDFQKMVRENTVTRLLVDPSEDTQ